MTKSFHLQRKVIDTHVTRKKEGQLAPQFLDRKGFNEN